MIYNKSAHPVEVKKISVRLWALRDEIEAALERRMKECEAAGVPLYIEDIKNYYKLNPNPENDNVTPLKSEAASMADLMAEVSEDVKKEGSKEKEQGEESKQEEVKSEEEVKAQDKPVGENPSEVPSENQILAQENPENKTLAAAEGIIAEQTLQGLETQKPNPILDRPYQRQAPNLDKISYGFVLLSDITMDSVMAFIKDRYLQGQNITIEFLIPQAFMMNADVLYCNYFGMRSKIISSTKPDFRIQLRFTFGIPEEKNTLRKFLKSVEPSILKTDQKMAKKNVEGDLPT
jgi:hypothetical protein